MARSFSKSCEAEVKFKLPESNFTAHIFVPFHVTRQKSNYNVIFVLDVLQKIKIKLDFRNNFLGWKETKIPMKSINSKMTTNIAIQES